MKKVYIEGIGGAEITNEAVKYKKNLEGKDILYVTDKFELYKDKKADMYVKSESERVYIYIHILTNTYETKITEPAAITALRGAMSRVKKNVRIAYVYEGQRGGRKVHYIFIVDKNSLKDMLVAKTDKLSLTLKNSGATVSSIIFLNPFEGSMEELKAFKKGVGIPVYELREKGLTREDLIYDGVLLKDKLLPVVTRVKPVKSGKITTVEDEELIKNTYKGLAIVAVCAAIGLFFIILSVPYVKALKGMAPPPKQEKSVNYVEVVNDYGKLFQAVPKSDISSKLSTLQTEIAKYELEPLSYDISETSITAHIRTRNMKKALAFRKDFTGQCSNIEKEGPYYNFSVVISGK